MIAPASPHILLIESDSSLAQQMAGDLLQAGYGTSLANVQQDLFAQIDLQKPDLVIVDRMAGGQSGLQFCRQLRDRGLTIPILLLMGRDTVEDRVACLEAGADDYLLKPYRSDEFLRRLQLYLQREPATQEQLQFSNLMLDLSTRRASRNGRQIDLTMKEFDLLRFLMEHPREVLTREQILENVWGYDFMGESNVIEVYIRYLRLKIETEGEKRLVQTVRGVGYVLRES
ncbi:response regulator transcription factor NblR [Synechococcus elongatus]|uniref:Response regulator transcription factor n=1 Tax=Synechococcus elongatus PCC 11801 TaxID=2219813 RepID=A0AAN1UU26_SYNEL|nr:response regulator transcription factor [Synechococcus elongatus]AZB72130.1 DNA-binding response regulator [Synechococcus elongatus PCC 11801]